MMRNLEHPTDDVGERDEGPSEAQIRGLEHVRRRSHGPHETVSVAFGRRHRRPSPVRSCSTKRRSIDLLAEPAQPPDRRAERRAARREENRVEILDAAEKVFGDDGITNGSLRKIAAESGFSTAAIYLFFENKPHLVAETLTRRGDELKAAITDVAESDAGPLERLHRVIDDTILFFDDRPNFKRMLRHLRGSDAITGPTLGEFNDGVNDRFGDVMAIIAGMVDDGQGAGTIRAGDAGVLAHLFSVLVNEFILLTSPDSTGPGGLTTAQFHDLVDGALRGPGSGC
jgi:AcrR family transcriptional regulator